MEAAVHGFEPSLSMRSKLSDLWLLLCQSDCTYIQRIGTKSPHHYDIVEKIPALAGKEICATYYEWVVLKDFESSNCCLLNLVSEERIQLPPVSFRDDRFILSSHPTDPACRVVLYSENEKALKFCRPGEDKFVRKEATEIRTPFRFAVLGGKIYFFSIYGMTCIEFEDSTCCIRELKLKLDMGDWIDPVGKRAKTFREYGAAYSDFSKEEWVAVNSIAPLTIFLTDELNGMGHMCCPTIDSGIMSNAIYFLEENDTDYYAYRLEDESITMYPTDCLPIDNTLFSSWMVLPQDTPLLLQRDDMEEVGRQDCEETLEECESLTSWASLPPKLLSDILARLFARDYAVFHGVCKSWQRITPPCSLTSTPSIMRQQESSNVPLLMFLENRDTSVYKLFDPIHRKYQRLEIPELRGADIRYSRHGWLLASRRSDESLFFFNPLTLEKIELPDQPFLHDINLYFSSPPTSSDCLVVAVCGWRASISFLTLRRGENFWRLGRSADEPHKSLLPCSSPVVYNGLHYYACEDRRVVAFDLFGDDIRLVNSWSTSLLREVNDENRCDDENFMVEIDGVPALVVVPRDGDKINIFKWDLLENDWVVMEHIDLGNKDMFLSRRSCFLESVDYGGGMGNKIFLTLVDTDAMDGLFYSLKTHMYHTFYSGYCSESSYWAAKFHGGIWVQPLYTRSEDNLTWC